MIRVLLAENVCVPERSETILEARLDVSVGSGKVVIFEPEIHDEKDLLRVDEVVPVRVMNVNYFPMTLKKGTMLGSCSSISSVIRSVHSSVSQANNLPTGLKKFNDISYKDIPPTHLSKLRQLVKKSQKIFDIGEEKGGRTNVVQHRIHTGNARPIRQSARRLPFAKKEEAGKIVTDMGKEGLIEPSDSPGFPHSY
nr:uncharacterized protein LOC111516502 [Leptinotarsa decemlineata]